MSLTDWLLGRPLRTSDAEDHRVSVLAAIPILGLDALSSAAYGPEAALTILLPLGALGLGHVGPIVGLIVALLFVLYFSYRQTMSAYPNGGGSYTVAKENLGPTTGLFAAAALLLDYVLTVAVGISAGVGALVSAIPALHSHILGCCLAILAVITLVNLRGVRESGAAFFVPTYLFIFSLVAVLAVGIVQSVLHGGRPVPVAVPPSLPVATAAVAPWLLMRAFASGCTAMTGVEAVSNGIQAFAKPRTERAQQTLTSIVVLLAMMLLGIAYLCRAYHIGATDPDSAQYESVVSQIVAAVVGRGAVYYVTLGSVIAVLALSANTGFADFPRLCHLLAEDEYLPHLFAVRGRRLVYSTGIVILAILCAILLVAFGGITDRLIPLFAIGAFLAFTLSQAGMVQHWRIHRGPRWKSSMAINFLGAVSTGVALAVILVAKFAEGAWITVILIPVFVGQFAAIHKHYRSVRAGTLCRRPLDLSGVAPPIVVVPIKTWSRVAERALRFAMSVSPDVVGIHIDADEEDSAEFSALWKEMVVRPARADGRPLPDLKYVRSPYRRFIGPVLDEVRQLSRDHPNRTIAIVVPELVETNLIYWPLHNHRANLLKAALLFNGGSNVVVVNVPWYIQERKEPEG